MTKKIIEPLDTRHLAEEIDNATLLGSLGRAFAEPIHPDDSAVEYVPTQYLSEVIRAADYDGMCFESALNPLGTNVVIFDPTNMRITRRGWIFTLGQAQYSIRPDPKRMINKGSEQKWIKAVSSVLGS